MTNMVCWEEDGKMVCWDEETYREKRIKEYIDSKLKELLENYEVEITIDPTTLKGVGKWRKK